MPEFVVELYVAREGADEVSATAERVRAAADEVAAEGASVRFVRSLFVPNDETCFLIFEAESPDAVHAAASLAELRFDRVTEAVTTPALAPRQE